MDPQSERLWTPADVAEYLGVPVATLYQWRSRKTGPRGCRVGKHLRYDPATVRAWVAAQTE
ncbi:MAG TPA: helix-turn-helix domain-containing protein [Actinomycetes bacterium]|nr:helix-turn-helix domain-containing protein [Actinomycetes bacterium]